MKNHFTILLANDSGIDSRKNAKNGQGIGIAIIVESESAQARESPGICRVSREIGVAPSGHF